MQDIVKQGAIFEINYSNKMIQKATASGNAITITWYVNYCVMLVLPLLMLVLASSQFILASPTDKWDENIRPIIVTDYLKDKNAGKKHLLKDLIGFCHSQI